MGGLARRVGLDLYRGKGRRVGQINTVESESMYVRREGEGGQDGWIRKTGWVKSVPWKLSREGEGEDGRIKKTVGEAGWVKRLPWKRKTGWLKYVPRKGWIKLVSVLMV